MAKNHFSRSDLGSLGVFLGASLVYKSGLRILIRATEVPFLVPPEWPKQGHFSHFGGTKNCTLGTQIGPRKVIFGHFIDFEYFRSEFSCFYNVKQIKTSNGHTRIVYGFITLKFFCGLHSPNRTIYPETGT